MSGFGIREQWRVGRELAAAGEPLWRPASFLQQLSLNGSMLLAKNHDPYWLAELAVLMNERGRGWSSLTNRLRSMPGSDARRLLWRASYRWWERQMAAYPEQCYLAWRVNSERPKQLMALESALLRSSAQLRALAWCEFDVDRQPISVVDLEAAIAV